MTRRHNADQLGFDALLASAERDNVARQIGRECAHLPGTMDEAVPFLRGLIERHHAAMLAGNAEAVLALHREAHQLAEKLNNFEPGILGGPDAPGSVLERETRAPDGTVPLWGQTGAFDITVGAIRARIDMHGVFGVTSCYFPWPGFAARAVDPDRPFISETGYRSFVGLSHPLEPGFTPDAFAASIISAQIRRLKGRLPDIKPEYRRRIAGAAP